MKAGTRVRLNAIGIEAIDAAAKAHRGRMMAPGLDVTLYVPDISLGEEGMVVRELPGVLFSVSFAKAVIICSNEMVEEVK
jgi:hypothetical protein